MFGPTNFPRRWRGSNPGPLAQEASALTTRLPRFLCSSMYMNVLRELVIPVKCEHAHFIDTPTETSTRNRNISKNVYCCNIGHKKS